MHEDNKNKQDSNYDIEFIDPQDLITFISDEQSEGENEELPGRTEDFEENFKYSEILKESSSDYVIKRREDTRGRLALVYTIFTFLIFLIIIIVSVLDGLVRKSSIIENLNTLLPLVSGIFLGTLGFVLGYYFKKGDDS